MYQLIATPFLEDHLVVRPSSTQGMKIPRGKYRQLQQSAPGAIRPEWLVDAVHKT